MSPSLKMAAEVVTHAVEQPGVCAQHCRIGMEKRFLRDLPWADKSAVPLWLQFEGKKTPKNQTTKTRTKLTKHLKPKQIFRSIF